MVVTFILEASHLFRSGDKFQTQFFVMDVVKFLKRKFYNNTEDFQVIVLHGSVKDEQAERYSAALERYGVRVVRMKPIASVVGNDKVFYKPTYYIHKMMGNEIPKGSEVMLVGFHNPRYLTLLEKYANDYGLSMAAFTTPSKKTGWMTIPEEFKPFLKHVLNLDDHVVDIKSEFKKTKKSQ